MCVLGVSFATICVIGFSLATMCALGLSLATMCVFGVALAMMCVFGVSEREDEKFSAEQKHSVWKIDNHSELTTLLELTASRDTTEPRQVFSAYIMNNSECRRRRR